MTIFGGPVLIWPTGEPPRDPNAEPTRRARVLTAFEHEGRKFHADEIIHVPQSQAGELFARCLIAFDEA